MLQDLATHILATADTTQCDPFVLACMLGGTGIVTGSATMATLDDWTATTVLWIASDPDARRLLAGYMLQQLEAAVCA